MRSQARPGSVPTAAMQIRQAVSDVIKQLHVPRVIWGTVITVTPPSSVLGGGPLVPTLTVQKSSGGDPVPLVRYLGSYAPTIGDTVIGFSVAEDYWVIGGVGVGGGMAGAAYDIAAAAVSTASATYTTLGGPTVQVLTGETAEVTLTAQVGNTSGDTSYMGVAVSGATTQAAVDSLALTVSPASGFVPNLLSATFVVEGLTPGVNTFDAEYRTVGGTANYQYRQMIVRP